MITLITGAPGSGKSAMCVELLMGFQKEGRALYVDGIPDLKLNHLSLENPHKWHEDVPDGAVIVIDEVQRIWRPQAAGKAVPPEIAALETHRHKGLEFVLMTQHPSLVHSNVRRLVGRHVHLRDLGILGRHMYEWPECANPESWKQATIKKRFRLPKKTFSQYKSASLHVKSVRSFPPALIVALIAIPLFVFLSVRGYLRVSEMTKPDKGRLEKILNPSGKKVEVESVAQRPVRVLPVDAAIAAAALAPVEKPRLVGCIQFSKRCECVDEFGFSATVELDLCLKTSARGGLAVPYDVRGTTAVAKGSIPKPSPSASKPKPALRQAGL